MDLTHRFTVPTDVEETWAHFQDIASVAECFPGATVSSVEDDTFQGSCKVKLGPIALVYNGSGTFIEKDEANHSFLVEAKGKDKRGNGTAGATVTLTMTGADGGATDVEVLTDLAITGKPAQFGRGVMQDVSDKLLGQFVNCLEERLSGGGAEQQEPEPAQQPDHAGSADDDTPIEAAARSASSNGAATSAPETPKAAETAAPTPRPAPRPASGGSQDSSDDALDLGAAVIPVLLKSYGKQIGVGAAVVLLIVWLVRRR